MKKTFLHIYLMFLTLFFISTTVLKGQTNLQKEQILEEYDMQKLKQLQQANRINAQQRRERVIRKASLEGVPLIIRNANGSIDELVDFTPEGLAVYYTIDNVDAARSTRTDHLNNGGSLGLNLEGQNMTVHVWDGGASRPTHQEFDGLGGNNRVSIGDGVTARNGNSFHAMHVAGTIVASGFVGNAKGMAPQASAITYTWTNDLAEATTAASNGMLLSNHSYGTRIRDDFGNVIVSSYQFGAYLSAARDWDNLMYIAPYYLMVKSAGNSGNDNTANGAPLGGNSSYDKLLGNATAKNNLVIANAQDASVASNGTLTAAVAINSSSSEGPTDDLRIKPDITGNGTGVFSTFDNADDAYNNLSGTSMSAPNVTGSLLLIQQHYNNINSSFMRASTLKGLALHTADDAGINGPDAIFGWGLLNAKVMAEAVTQNGNEAKIEELVLNNGQSYTINVQSDGINPLIASVSWTDPAGTVVNSGTNNLSTPVLVNDLDIRVTQNTSTFTPYKLTGVNSNTQADNNVDPYERIDVPNASGSYTITITHKGTLSGGSQNYSLIVTGLSSVPCVANVPTGLTASNIGSTNATLSWDVVPSASYDLRYRESGTSTWTTVAASGNSSTITGLSVSTTYEAQVRSKCSSSNSAYSASVNFSTTAISCSSTVSSFPYAEGFESGDGWTQVTGDDGNWVRNSGVTPSNNTGPSSAVQGSYYMFLEASTNNSPGRIGNNATAILESPCFDLSSESAATFTFQYHMYGSNVGSLTVQASSDGTNFSDLWTLSGNQGNSWQSVDVNLGSYTGATVKLRLVGTTGPGWSSDIAVDDLSVTTGTADTQAPSVPTGLSTSNITTSSIDLSWNASTDNVGVTGYDVYVDNVLNGSSAATVYSITGLSANTSYALSVRAKDAAGNTSAISSAISATTAANTVTYCASSGTNANFEWIDYVALGDMTNTTGSDGGYGDYTSVIANVNKGANRVYISAGFSGQSYTEFWKVWIDYDQDGVFESSEEVANGSSNSANNLYADFTIPASALTGQTRMRVSMKYNSAQTACEDGFAYGEVEDYTVNISNSVNALAVYDGPDILDNETMELGLKAPKQILVYPNPSESEFKLETENRQVKSVKVISLSGETVLTINNYKGNPIDIHKLNKGVYIVHIFDGQKTLRKKLKKE